MGPEGTVTIEREGRTFTGTWCLTGKKVKMITVSSAYGSKSTQLGGMKPEHLARLLLSELIQEYPIK